VLERDKRIWFESAPRRVDPVRMTWFASGTAATMSRLS